jgi:hypothetical protein
LTLSLLSKPALQRLLDRQLKTTATASDITVGAHTTLAYSENSNAPSLGATEGCIAAALALLGTYMAGSFVAAAYGHGGTLVTQAQPRQQPLLTHPQA